MTSMDEWARVAEAQMDGTSQLFLAVTYRPEEPRPIEFLTNASYVQLLGMMEVLRAAIQEGPPIREILKVQVNSEGDSVLCYNEDRTLSTTFEGEDAKRVMADLEIGPLGKKYMVTDLHQGGIMFKDEVKEGLDW